MNAIFRSIPIQFFAITILLSASADALDCIAIFNKGEHASAIQRSSCTVNIPPSRFSYCLSVNQEIITANRTLIANGCLKNNAPSHRSIVVATNNIRKIKITSAGNQARSRTARRGNGAESTGNGGRSYTKTNTGLSVTGNPYVGNVTQLGCY